MVSASHPEVVRLSMQRVTSEEFYAAIGPLNVQLQSQTPSTSEWGSHTEFSTKYPRTVVGYSFEGEQYFLTPTLAAAGRLAVSQTPNRIT